MYPVLFPESATTFTSQGLGTLSSAIECTVTEERNGEYELFMRYPETGAHYSEIVNSSIICVIPSDGASRQPFRVYKVTRPINGVISVYAQHISYQLSFIPVSPFTASGAAATLAGLKSHALEACPFTFTTDITGSGNYTQEVPESLRSRLGGQEGSVLDVFGGEYEWDKYAVKLWASRGTDSNVGLRYGKNITDISQEENIENTYTGICPYWKNDEELVTLPEGVIHANTAANFPFQRAIPVDFSASFEDAPTVAQLRAVANSYITKNHIGIPKVSIKVSFIALWQTEEYKDFATLQRVKLCDTVHVYFDKLGIDTTAKVVKTVFDCIRERYTSIEIGEVKSSLADTVAETSVAIETTAKELTAETQKAISTATKYITGAKGGYVKINIDPDTKTPYELLIMEKDNVDAPGNKMWRWNKEGWGYFPNGYNGGYTVAATMDGAIVADFITAGTMKADRIHGGTLVLGGDDNGNGIMQIRDAEETTRGEWSKDGVRLLWINETTQEPTDHLSINSEAGGVIYIQEVKSNSTVDTPVPADSGAATWLSSQDLTFDAYDTGYHLQGYMTHEKVVVQCLDAEATRRTTVIGADGTTFECDVDIADDWGLDVGGTKNRAVQTDFGIVRMTAYETASPFFGDIGSGVCGDDGLCFIELDAQMADVCNLSEYHVFISPYGGASLSVERFPGYFIVSGQPGDEFAWEVKAKQLNYEANRFDVKIPKEKEEYKRWSGRETIEESEGITDGDEESDVSFDLPDDGGAEAVDSVL